MLERRAVRNVLLAVACVLLVLGLYQSRPRAADNRAIGTVRLVRKAFPAEELILPALARNAVGTFAGTEAEIQDATLYRKSVTYRGEVHPRAGEFSYCGRISTVNLPGIHARYRNFVAAVWLSFDGTPLPRHGDETSFALVDDPGVAAEHGKFAAQAAAVCKNEVLPEVAATEKQPVAANQK